MEMPSDLNSYLVTLNRRDHLDAGSVIDSFSSVIDRYYNFVGQVENSTWQELGQESITNNMLPEVGTWLDALESNIDVLDEACNGYNEFKTMLITLKEYINQYNELAAIEEKDESVESKMAHLEKVIDELSKQCEQQKSYLEGLNNKIASISVDITVPGTGNNTEQKYELTLSSFVDEIGKNIRDIAGLTDVEGYSQKDKRWAKMDFFPGKYEDSACGPTALATVLSYCKGEEILPTDTGGIEDFSFFTTVYGTKYYAAVATAILYGVDSKIEKDVNADNIRAELLEGHPIVYGINYKEGGHYIALTNIDSNDIVTVKDPIGEIYTISLSDLVNIKREGVPFVSFTPLDTVVEDYNDMALLTQSVL